MHGMCRWEKCNSPVRQANKLNATAIQQANHMGLRFRDTLINDSDSVPVACPPPGPPRCLCVDYLWLKVVVGSSLGVSVAPYSDWLQFR